MSWEEWLERYLTENRLTAYSPATAKSYRHWASHLVKYTEKDFCDISKADILGFRSYLASKGLKESSIIAALKCLKGLFTFLRNEGAVEKHPIPFKLSKEDRRDLPKFLTFTGVWAFLLKARNNDVKHYRRFRVLYVTGLRLEELESLSASMWESDQLRIVGKGRRERIIPIVDKPTGRILNTAFKHSEQPFGSMKRRYMEVLAHRYAKKAGLGRDVTPHRFRHTFATHLRVLGTPLDIIQYLLGHSDLKTTQIYARIPIQGLKENLTSARKQGYDVELPVVKDLT